MLTAYHFVEILCPRLSGNRAEKFFVGVAPKKEITDGVAVHDGLQHTGVPS
jgi:hypothetical protein